MEGCSLVNLNFPSLYCAFSRPIQKVKYNLFLNEVQLIFLQSSLDTLVLRVGGGWYKIIRFYKFSNCLSRLPASSKHLMILILLTRVKLQAFALQQSCLKFWDFQLFILTWKTNPSFLKIKFLNQNTKRKSKLVLYYFELASYKLKRLRLDFKKLYFRQIAPEEKIILKPFY